MREIKFRGIAESGLMVYGDLITQGYYAEVEFGLIRCGIQLKSGYTERIPDKKSVGQYTGLKDQNGIEVYEGDIVEILDNELSPGRYLISWREDVYMMVGTGGHGEWLCLEEFEGCQIIGNVHQHPHLLK